MADEMMNEDEAAVTDEEIGSQALTPAQEAALGKPAE
jgi:hypothetical protein